ncbi:MAG TPA: M20/M25/M40 family metallo-hydrolase [Pyrinomonadaceae bacterium]|nr:M20/M25/M40 family metallo-hydrolase [Pyrinomonadaceae bacterium]
MLSRRRNAAPLLCALLLFANLPAAARQTPASATQPQSSRAQTPQAQPTPDPNDPVQRIRDEALNRSQIMRTLDQLTNVIGPRLTGSPGMRRANEWTREQLAKWGLQNAHVEPWGTFGRGWSLRRFSADAVEPQAFPLNAYPKAWSPATRGPLTAEVVYVDAKDEAGLQKFKGQLRGKIVLNGAVRDPAAHFDPEGTRRTEKELLELANAPDPATAPPRPRVAADMRAATRFNSAKLFFYQQEGAALVVDPSRGDGGNIFVQQAQVPQALPTDPQALAALLNRDPDAPRQVRAWDKDAPAFAPQVVLSIEHYNRLARMLQAGERVRASFDIEAQFLDQDLTAANTVAEIPGTDLKDEVVMLGGHLDSWHGATGATDNAAGVAVAMEAVRIIKALGLQPRRTIRVALWSGEEQGLLGSRAYVEQHFGKLETPQPTPRPTPEPTPGAEKTQPSAQPVPTPAPARLITKPEYDKFSVYFNLDNGTGKIRGVYMQGNEQVRAPFRRWLAPFADLGAQTLTLSNTGSTDHVPFNDIGLPGFQFIQDGVEYNTRTHHSTQDTFERIQPDDVKQAAAIMAAFVYQAAMLDERLPRKPAPGIR